MNRPFIHGLCSVNYVKKVSFGRFHRVLGEIHHWGRDFGYVILTVLICVCNERTDAMDHLTIRFHFGGYLVSIDRQFKYVGGSNAMSYVEIDKLSLPEIKGHLADHVPLTDSIRLHWLMPGMEVDNGLQLLVDDSSCQVMYEHMGDGGVVEIYVEGAVKDKDLRSFREFYKSPSKQSQASSSAGIHVEDPIPSENSDENVAVRQ